MNQYIHLFFMSKKASWLSNTQKNYEQKRMGKIIKHLGDTRKQNKVQCGTQLILTVSFAAGLKHDILDNDLFNVLIQVI